MRSRPKIGLMYFSGWNLRPNRGTDYLMKSILTVLVLALAVWAFQPPAMAQKKDQREDANTRSVQGAVTDAAGNPLADAVVYLKNTKTLQIRSVNSKEGGAYAFHGLSTNIDYELKAEQGGVSSDPKTLSVFDSRAKAVINLKLKK